MALNKVSVGLFVTGVVGVLCLVVGCMLIHFLPIIIHNGIEDNVEISPDSASYDNWKHPDSPIYFQVWVFDLVNYENVSTGAQPHLVQKGPYTYREKRHKFNITFSKKDTVLYREAKNYYFVPEKSVGFENDTFHCINIPLVTVLNMVKDSNFFVKKAVKALMDLTGEKLFLNRTVHQLLWGYKDEFLTGLEDIAKTFHYNLDISDTFGLFVNSNGTDDGVYEVYTGKGDIDKVGEIASWKGQRHLSYWTSDIANMINGSDGTAYAPFVDQNATKFIFSSDLCRSIGMDYTDRVTNRGISMYRYVAPEILFGNVTINPDNAGFCTPNDTCLPSGLLNVSNCRNGAPIVMSMPHFLGCDPDIVDSVEGLDPNQTLHQSFLDVEPNSGVVMRVAKKLQINLFVKPIQEFSEMEKLREVYLPVMWLDENAMIGKKSAEEFKDGLFGKVKLTNGIKWALIGFGGLVMLVVIVVLAFRTFGRDCAPVTIRKTIKFHRFGINTDDTDVLIT